MEYVKAYFLRKNTLPLNNLRILKINSAQFSGYYFDMN